MTLYKTSDSPHYYREIHLADILAVDPMINPAIYPLSPPHVFEIVTSSLTYYVGVDMAGALPKDLAPPPDSDSECMNVTFALSLYLLHFVFSLG